MKHLSPEKLADLVVSRRKAKKLSQTELARRTGINRSLLSRLEQRDYHPSADQLLALMDALDFSLAEVTEPDGAEAPAAERGVERKRVAVAGTGYVGLSLAVLLSQHHEVTAVDILEEKVEKLRRWQSPIRDEYIEKENPGGA